MKKKYIISVIVIMSIVIVDQIISFFVQNNFSINESIIIIKDFLSFYYIINEGAAFGLFKDNLIFLLFINTLLLVYLFNELRSNEKMLTILSISLILGGSFGNVIDRIIYDGVIDYISFTLFKWQAPIFNFADIMITFGIIIMFLILIRESIYEYKNKKRRQG